MVIEGVSWEVSEEYRGTLHITFVIFNKSELFQNEKFKKQKKNLRKKKNNKIIQLSYL